ncbi:adenylate/guanylate cyclase domain-containing protein [Algoriphagus sp. CAU 1675]|uniref:adenylate/guanylate cyclase domain-containing protein n=1 Tax=Algoriphagus sp. CAU 1675 TaxID=3032597 RepID=UPI0023DCA3FB|nr:adenylate/guanylate cyclase domain-containing protein [Algoriphagus sp. CAU 1675]MDF2156785.1 adenylate/guanylate cyclase domain-containing protein [Algoriphagus sp. CAU 1675]
MSEKLIYESKKSKIYFFDDSEWQQPVLLKVLNYEFPTPKDISQFYNEFEIIESLNIKGARLALKRLKYQGKHAMYLEWVQGNTIKDAFKGKQESLDSFLKIAIQVTRVISELHEQNIIHKDISGNNIIVDLSNNWVKIIDFGIASKLTLKEQNLGNPEHLDGTLEYISPEQTGRMNRAVDYRTDLYSLGIVFYEMLTGVTPFEGMDPMGIVHGHIAVTPVPVHERNPKIPLQVSEIISHLLAKASEDRYQSAFGLEYDLELCLKQLNEQGEIDSFPLKSRDFSGKFTLPQKLYGRDKELETLMAKFDEVARGNLEVVLVSGYSGTGKSVLVHEIHKPITQKAGYFIEGKFDQFQKAIPYYALLQAFGEFVEILLGENESRLRELKESIVRAIGEEGKVLTDVLPSLELIIGPQPEIPELGGNEAQNRFNYVFRKFVNAVSTESHPIVIFIDDLQWADSSSLSLIQSLATDPDNDYLFFIGAYRDNEVSPSHPFMMMVENLRQENVEVFDLKIGNLSFENLSQLIADSLDKNPGDIFDLAELVYKKTQGNAFFLTQFLKSIFEDGLLEFDRATNTWVYDLRRIQEKNITDNVVELMASRILKLPEASREILKLAACFGNKFDLQALSLIHESEDSQSQADLKPALLEGLILPKGDSGYKFAHDRIQQAVYSLIPDSERDSTHLKIGRQFLRGASPEYLEDHLFDIVNQLNSGVSLLTDSNEREELCRLNLRAGKKAKESSAFRLAFDYLMAGIGLLPPNPWEREYDITLQLHALAGETSYLNGDFSQMNEMIGLVLGNASNILDKVKSYEIRILAFKAENKLIEAINTGLEFLEQLGEKFPKKPNMLHVMLALIKSKIELRGKDNTMLSNLPIMTNDQKIAAMRIMADIASSSYWATPTLFPLIIFRMVHISLKYGNTAVSSFAFGTYGVIMCGVLGAMKSGYQFGKLGLILLEKFKAKEWKTQVYTPIYCLIVNWNEHIDKTLKPLQESYHIGMETGAIEFACINTNIYCIHSYLGGRPLERLEVETRAYSESFAQFKQETNFNYNEVYRQGMLNLLGRSQDPVKLKGEAYDEDKMMIQNRERNDQTGTFFMHFNKLILCYHFGRYEEGRVHAQESRKLLEAVLAKFEIPNHHFYEALTLLALCDTTTYGSKRRSMLSRVRKNAAKLKKWAKDAPENYQHKYDLIMAERMRLKGNLKEAALLYDKAMRGASEQNFIHEEAIAGELAGKFYIRLDAVNLAEHFLKSSYNSYREWGAHAKLSMMEQQFPQYVSSIHNRPGLNEIVIDSSSSVGNSSMMLDLSTVLKASSSISQEIVLQKLLKKLMKIVMENAGADRGVLLLKDGNEFFIETIAQDGGQEEEILQHLNYQGSGLLSEKVISYVTQSGKSLVLQDAKNDHKFTNCQYIKNAPVQSILSLPVINLGKLTGVLYLENNHSTAAFTQDRVDLLALLSGQIAVSLNNALLYENLEQKVAERTLELEEEKRKSDELLLNILPLEIAEELKVSRITTPRHFESVTVLFTDFKGFTQLSEILSPNELVEELGTCFSAFDRIVDKYKIEKIKTIGDSYMCVGGLPVANNTHAFDTVLAALEIRDWVDQYMKNALANNKPVFQIRIGLHTGPVIAGVVGHKKFAYDVWGDTVNTAARMESSGEVGKVNVSGQTFEIIQNDFACTYRGKVEAKNKGQIDMYFVERPKDIQYA